MMPLAPLRIVYGRQVGCLRATASQPHGCLQLPMQEQCNLCLLYSVMEGAGILTSGELARDKAADV